MTDAPDTQPPSDPLRTLLRGFPEATVQACAEFQAHGGDEAFDRAVFAVIEHHLSTPPTRPLAQMPGSTQLVTDLGLDSLTMVEMTFLFEDIFSLKLPHEELIKVVTLDELRALLRAQLPGRPSAAA